MRIVGGSLRGRAILPPLTSAIRPTSDRLREAVFNILIHAHDDIVSGARVADLFAGTGALGLEAISRGAAFALFVEEDSAARALVRGNIEALGLGGVTRIFRRDATKLGDAPAGAPFTLAFLDPPYGRDLAVPALAALANGHWLAPNALCVIEESGKAVIDLPEGYALVERRDYAETQFVFARYKAL